MRKFVCSMVVLMGMVGGVRAADEVAALTAKINANQAFSTMLTCSMQSSDYYASNRDAYDPAKKEYDVYYAPDAEIAGYLSTAQSLGYSGNYSSGSGSQNFTTANSRFGEGVIALNKGDFDTAVSKFNSAQYFYNMASMYYNGASEYYQQAKTNIDAANNIMH